MNKIIKTAFLAALCTVSSVSFAQNAPEELPKIFTSQKADLQDRICGEMLAGFAIAGARQNKPEKIEFAKEMATESVLFLSMHPAMSKDEKVSAKNLSRKIESLTAEEHVATTRSCTNRIKFLRSSNQITQAEYIRSQEYAQNILAQVLSQKKK
jgi:hypothetical protein